MHTYTRWVTAAISKLREEHGVTSLVMGVSGAMLLGVTAVALDLGNAWMVKQELRNAADAAALAGAGQLGQIYKGLSAEDQKNYYLTSEDLQTIVDQVQTLTPKSAAGGNLLTFSADDIVLGEWESATSTFTPVPVNTPGAPAPTAVQVLVRRDATVNQPLQTFFGGLLGVESINIDAPATAALTTISSSAPGGIGAPIAISQAWLESGNCGGNIKFYPTGDIEGCAGWHTFTDPNSSASNLDDIIEGLEDGSFTAPEAYVGQTLFQFNGGTVASVFNSFEDLYHSQKDEYGNWTVLVPVYNRTDCGNPSGPIMIVGFVTAVIYQVQGAPAKIVNATVQCETFGAGRGDGTSGSGNNLTPLGTIPGLVG